MVMKILKLIVVLLAALTFVSCQKDVSSDVSVGTLKTSAGDCLPATLNGFFRVDSVLTNDNYMDVQVQVTLPGSFDVKSDTVNGYSFAKTGGLGSGLRTIRLYATGKPIAAGTNTFTIAYGTTSCKFTVRVDAVTTGGAVFILGGAPGNCSGVVLAGAYAPGTAMTPGNTVTMNVNVISTGSYTVSTPTVNGIQFAKTGSFATTGIQSITLTATGTPVSGGVVNFPVSTGSSDCSFSVNFTASPPATYTLGGSPATCTGVALTGTYQAGVSTNAANTATVDVMVTTTGAYTLTTTTVNGVKFSAAGNFTITGAQTVTLTANTAIPTSAGTFSYPITGASTTCTFPVTYAAPPPPAVYTLSGAPGSCAPVSVNGTYTAGTALIASNNVDVEVNVTTAGLYTLSTDLVNGMKFTSSGTFTTTGLQTVNLKPVAGSNPVAAGTSTLTPQIGASSCTFDIVVGAPSTFLYSFQIGATTFAGPCSAIFLTVGGAETLYIFSTSGPTLKLYLDNDAGPVTTGFYTGSSSTGKSARFEYNMQLAGFPGSGFTNLSANLTSINTTTRVVQGTFSGTVVDLMLNTYTVTNGTFKADY